MAAYSDQSFTEDGIALCSCCDSVANGSSLIDNMWDGFCVSDYVSERVAKRSPPSTASKFTIPVPFSMTLREEAKKTKQTITRSMMIAEKERKERQAIEESHLTKQFKATPVPATTSLPLYEMINAINEQRRQDIKRNSKQLLKMTEKPFSFTVREEIKRKERQVAVDTSVDHEPFHSNPLPHFIFDTEADEKLKEEEVYRKIRIRLRALETLADSHLPQRMKESVGKLRKINNITDLAQRESLRII